MIPANFDYAAPESLDEAISALSQGGDDAKLIAGGHSLLPLMKLRLAAPSLLVSLGKVPGLSGIERSNGGFSIGAMTRHAEIADAEELGVAAHAASLIADQQVRNRGTIGGSIAHGDSAGDLPTVFLAAEGNVTAKGPNGERQIQATEMFKSFLTTAVGPDEVVTSVYMPAMEGYGWGYEKFVRRSEDWAMVGVCALVKSNGGTCEDVRVALTHMGATPLRASATEEALRGQSLSPESIAQAAEQAAEGTNPPGDVNATP
ncbi:MAG TPA: xanthine dehydrogenase family protein subunit M, partial [Thermoleophilaceae bacterium]|nr:xanthine dehydrogenase family protein subunit M [Thermoleophilaceae bacterium]